MAIVQIDRLCWIIEIWIVGWVLIGASVKLVYSLAKVLNFSDRNIWCHRR